MGTNPQAAGNNKGVHGGALIRADWQILQSWRRRTGESGTFRVGTHRLTA
jgi:hypothetical protein